MDRESSKSNNPSDVLSRETVSEFKGAERVQNKPVGNLEVAG